MLRSTRGYPVYESNMFKISNLWLRAIVLFEGFARHLTCFSLRDPSQVPAVNAALALATQGLLPDIAIVARPHHPPC